SNRRRPGVNPIVGLQNADRLHSSGGEPGYQGILNPYRSVVVGRTGNHCGTAVAQLDNMLNGLVDPNFIIDGNVKDQLACRIIVTKHHGNFSSDEFGRDGSIHRRSYDGNSADITLPELAQSGLSSFPIVLGVA